MESLRSRREQPGSWTFGEVQKQLDTNEVIDLSNEAPPTGEDLAADDGESVSARTFEGNPSGPWAINEDDDLRRREILGALDQVAEEVELHLHPHPG